MHNDLSLSVDGKSIPGGSQMTVAAALANAGVLRTRRSVSGQTRFALCGMGVCQECRVSIDGQPHSLACQVICRSGMVVTTGGEGP